MSGRGRAPRATLAHAALAFALCAACGAPSPAAVAPAPTPASPLRTGDVAELVPAAGLAWLVLARPGELAARADLIPTIHELVPESRFAAFAEKNALDVRAVEQLAVARYAETTLFVAKARVDAARVEAAFTAHLREVSGRAIDRPGDATSRLVRTWGQGFADGPSGREQLALLGTGAFALEQGRLDRVRAVELFAEGRLKKAAPALKTALLARAAELVGDAPLRAFAPGPFDGEARSLGGLLVATTAVAVAVRFPPARAAAGTVTPAEVRLALLGAWGDDGPAAAARLLVVFETLAASPLGHLCGLDHPLRPPTADAAPDALLLDVAVDALAVTRGLHAAVDAQVDEIMRYGSRAPAATAPPR